MPSVSFVPNNTQPFWRVSKICVFEGSCTINKVSTWLFVAAPDDTRARPRNSFEEYDPSPAAPSRGPPPLSPPPPRPSPPPPPPPAGTSCACEDGRRKLLPLVVVPQRSRSWVFTCIGEPDGIRLCIEYPCLAFPTQLEVGVLIISLKTRELAAPVVVRSFSGPQLPSLASGRRNGALLGRCCGNIPPESGEVGLRLPCSHAWSVRQSYVTDTAFVKLTTPYQNRQYRTFRHVARKMTILTLTAPRT